MKNEYKTTIYPFDVESIPLIRHNNLIDNYKIINIISPSGWGLCGKDAGYVDNGPLVGITVDSDFDKALDNCDTVFFINSSRKIDLDKFIYPKIIKAAQSLKNIVCSIELKDEMIQNITNICNKNNIFFKYFTDTCESVTNPPNEKIYELSTPIIFVVGLGGRMNKFEIQLSIRENLKKIGYKISQVGTRHYCELMDFHSFPKFMYSKFISESEKITLFNHYIKKIEIEENPDIIIIGVPGGTMPYNYEFTNKFGILAYEVSQAVIPDSVVLSISYDNLSASFFELTSKSYKYKFGYDIDCFNISNVSLNYQASKLESSMQYIALDWEFINENKQVYKESPTPVYNIFDKNDAQSMSNFLVNKLTEYGQSKII